MTMLAMQRRVHDARILDRTELAPDVVLLGVYAPDAARFTKPGQFAMLMPPGGEQAAVALGIYEASGDRVSFMFFVCGRRTRELSRLHVGDELSFFGPLGNGFFLDDGITGDIAIVAGGVGIASVLLPAQTLIARGLNVHLYYGARTAERLVDAQRFIDAGCELHEATDDGSRGYHGVVSDLLAQAQKPPAHVLACGPTPMLRATARVAAEVGAQTQLSLEETFACGVGGCWGCVVPLVGTSKQAPSFPPVERDGSNVVNARICAEGPVFWAHELRW